MCGAKCAHSGFVAGRLPSEFISFLAGAARTRQTHVSTRANQPRASMPQRPQNHFDEEAADNGSNACDDDDNADKGFRLLLFDGQLRFRRNNRRSALRDRASHRPLATFPRRRQLVNTSSAPRPRRPPEKCWRESHSPTPPRASDTPKPQHATIVPDSRRARVCRVFYCRVATRSPSSVSSAFNASICAPSCLFRQHGTTTTT